MNIIIKIKKYITAFCKGIFVIQLKFIFSFLIKKLESMADPEGLEPSTSTSVVQWIHKCPASHTILYNDIKTSKQCVQ